MDKNLVKENDNIRKYMQQMKVADSQPNLLIDLNRTAFNKWS